MQAYYFDPLTFGYEVKQTTIPEKYLESAKSMRDELLEKVSEFSDELLMLFLEGEEIPVSVLKEAIRKGTISSQFVPVFCGSSLKNKGIQLLLDGICDFLPSPLDIGDTQGFEPVTHNPVNISPDPKGPLGSFSFQSANR